MLAGAAPMPTAAAPSPSDVASAVLAAVNQGRVERDLVPYRTWDALTSLAMARARRMADARTLSHAAAGGNVGSALNARGLDWLGYGEAIGATGWPWGDEAAASIYEMFMDSAVHRGLLMSGTYNYVGIGAALASDGTTYISVVMTESPDHTAPTARTVSLDADGRSITLAWAGADPRLQTHTAGLRDFDVRFRRDDKTWRTIRDDITATALTLYDRRSGHWYLFRVRARDQRGNLSRWTTATRIWVP